jgi:ribonuclease HI
MMEQQHKTLHLGDKNLVQGDYDYVKNRPLVRIWTDGSTTPKNPGPGGWAALLVYRDNKDQDHERMIAGSVPYTSNIRMELTAALRALQVLQRPSTIILYTDSQYIIDGFKRLNRHQILKTHHDLWGLILHYKQLHVVMPTKVKAHSGEAGNERVDAIAKDAALRQIEDMFRTNSEKMIEKYRRLARLDESEFIEEPEDEDN